MWLQILEGLAIIAVKLFPFFRKKEIPDAEPIIREEARKMEQPPPAWNDTIDRL